MSEGEQRGRGRPSKLTARTLDKLCHALRVGASYEHASEFAGIDRVTFYRWRALAEGAPPEDASEQDRAEYADFCNVIKSAEAEGAVTLLGTIRSAAEGDGDPDDAEPGERRPRGKAQWQAGAWILERRWPEMYGRKERVEHSGPNGGPIPYANMTREERQKRIAEFEDRRAKARSE